MGCAYADHGLVHPPSRPRRIRERRHHAFLDALEPLLAAPLEADPNNQLSGQPVAAFFDERKAWISNRVASDSSQIEGFTLCPKPDATLSLMSGAALLERLRRRRRRRD